MFWALSQDENADEHDRIALDVLLRDVERMRLLCAQAAATNRAKLRAKTGSVAAV